MSKFKEPHIRKYEQYMCICVYKKNRHRSRSFVLALRTSILGVHHCVDAMVKLNAYKTLTTDLPQLQNKTTRII